MSARIAIGIEGIGVWAGGLPDWRHVAEALCGNVDIAPDAAARPAPGLLSANERRRAPESVLLAIEVAAQACAMTQHLPRDLPHVFASAYGDLAINDYLCATLARTPGDVSPTKFHNSVHNAPAGYWAIATGCRESSTAVAAGTASFGAGLLEAALLAQAQMRPVLLAAYDVPACGPLLDVIDCRAAFGAAFVLAPPSSRALATMELELAPATAALAHAGHLLHPLYAANPAARSLPLLHALARRSRQPLRLEAAPHLQLAMEILF